MEIREEKTGNVVIISLEGRLDGASYKLLHEKLNTLIHAGEKHLVIDLAGLEYMSSAGLRAFFMASKDLQRTEGKLIICSPQPEVRRVFDISGLPTPYPIMENREEAIQLLSCPPHEGG